MPDASRRTRLRSWCAGAGLLLALHTLAADHDAALPAQTWPPPAYALRDLSLRVQWQAASGLPAQALVLTGDGQGQWQREGTVRTFGLDAASVVDRINLLYALRFFDLPARMPAPRSVFLGSGGRVGTQALALHDATVTTLCFTLPVFEHCVSWSGQAPQGLQDLVQRLVRDAHALPAAPAPGRAPG